MKIIKLQNTPTAGNMTSAAAATANSLKVCMVCGDKALGYNFNAVTCESCKAFFRRNALSNKEFTCPFSEHCEITVVTRRFCQKCRLEKCFTIGMKKEYIMSEEDKLLKRKKIEQNRAKKRLSNSNGLNNNENLPVKIKREESSSVDSDLWTNREDIHTDNSSVSNTDTQQTDILQINNNQQQSFEVPSSTNFSNSTKLNFNSTSNNELSENKKRLPTKLLPSPKTAPELLDQEVNLCDKETLFKFISSTNQINNNNNNNDHVTNSNKVAISELSPPMPSSSLEASEIVNRLVNCPKDACKIINHLMKTPEDAVNTMSKIINSPKDALQLISHFISSPGDALQIISRIMNSPLDALTVFTQFMSSPTDALQIISKIVSSPGDVLQFMRQLMSSPADALQIMNKFMNAPAEALQIINKMMNHSEVDSTTSSQNVNHNWEENKCNENHENGNSMIKTMLGTVQTDSPINSITSSPAVNLPSISSCDGVSNGIYVQGSINDTDVSKTNEILQDIEADLIQPNSFESIICEAIKLEYESTISLSSSQTVITNNNINNNVYNNNNNNHHNLSRELNEVELAKLNELIVANKALYAPVDEDLSSLISDDCRIKSNENCQDPLLLTIINLTAIAIRRLIKMSKKISAFKNMCQEDQVALLKGGCTEMMVLRSVMQYDCDRDTWKIPHSTEANIKADVLKLAKGNIYEEHERFIRTFDLKWRTDENIILIMCAITLFTSDRPRTVHSDVIKLEQNSYYYLLRRYLESVYPGCEAKSTFLKLMQKINELHKLNEEVISVYLNVNPAQVEPLLREIFDLKVH